MDYTHGSNAGLAHKITVNNHMGILETVRAYAEIGGRLDSLRA
jgi:hypothetical protein